MLHTGQITTVDATIDDAAAQTLKVDSPRADVCGSYPAYPGCPNVGFSDTLATDILSACQHLLTVTSTDANGHKTILGERNFTITQTP